MWTLLQLADSAFPTGGFAHSAGLEAAVQGGDVATVEDVERFLVELIDQLAHGALPLVRAVHEAPERLIEIDALATAMLWSHVAARASRAQGRALLDVAARASNAPELLAVRSRGAHLAPAFGLVTRTLGVPLDEALATFLHLGLRGALSAAVRLGCCGPTEAQAIHLELHPALDAALATGRALPVEDAAQPAPIAELFGATHDRLYSRLFQS